jgi:hypothetical protein
MPNDNFNFSFDLAQVDDRQILLRQAGELIDARRSHLSGKQTAVTATPEGDLIRDLMLDQASLAPDPDVYRITDRDFLDRKRPVPVRFREMSRQFRFFWVRFPVGLMPRRDWAFNRLEVKVAFNPGGESKGRPKGYQILPDKRFQDLLKVSDRLEVSLDEKFEFAAQVAANVGVAKERVIVDVGAAAGLKIVAGPFNYRVAKAQIDNSGTGLDWVFWRLDGAEFFQENRPDLVVIAQVPKETSEFKIDAAMQAYRYFNFAAADLQEAIKELPSLIVSFFKAGAPLSDRKQYDLSDRL